MAADLNYCSFIGRLGRDPEIRYMVNGDAVANFSIAVGERWKDKATGDTKESTEWIRCSAFGKLAEICGEFLKKGGQVFVNGKMKTRKWSDKEGNDRYSTEIIVQQMQLLGSKPRDGEDRAQEPAAMAAPAEKKPAQQRQPAQAGSKFDDMEDDIPF